MNNCFSFFRFCLLLVVALSFGLKPHFLSAWEDHYYFKMHYLFICIYFRLPSGVENGLRLTINVEQYEYMPGPHDSAGVKMLLHDDNEVPRVHALGQAVSTGSHVFVGVKVLTVSSWTPATFKNLGSCPVRPAVC